MSIYQIEPVLLFDANMFIIDGDRPLLVDAGTGFKIDSTIASVEKILKGRKLEGIILTHRHFDHVGGAMAVSEATGAKLYAGVGDAAPLRAGDSESTMGVEFGGRIDPMPIIDLHDGDVVETGTYTLKVISTPGHTIGSICLYDDISKSLISGDTLFVSGIGRYDLPTASRTDLVESLRKLYRLQAQALYPGHGPDFKGNVSDLAVNGLRMLGERI